MHYCFSLLRLIKIWLGRQRVIVWTVLLAFVLTLPSLFCGLAGDDYFNRAVALQNADIRCVPRSPFDAFAFMFSREDAAFIKQGINAGLYPWWTHPQLQIAFFRPLSSLTHWLDFRLFPGSVWLMHAHSLIWYALLVLVAGLLYKQFLAPLWVAGLAALLYAVDYSHAVGAASLCNRNAVIAAVFSFLALIAHDRWRRGGVKICSLLAPACFFLGLLSAEAAIAIGGYLFAYALIFDKGKPFTRYAALLPYVITGIVWRIIYIALGYGAAHSGVYIDPAKDSMRFVAELGQRLPVLLQGQFALPPSDLWSVLPPVPAQIYAVCALAFIFFVAWVVWPILRRDSTIGFLAAGMLLAAIPFCSTLPSNRFLFFTGLGGMGLIARFLAIALEPPEWFLPYWRTPRKLLACGWILIWLAISPLLLALLTLSPLVMQKPLTLAAKTIAPPDIKSLHEQIVIVNVPSDLMLFYLPFVRAASGQSTGLHTFLLSAGLMQIEVQRINDRTVVLRLSNGLLAGSWNQVFRDSGAPIKKGAALKLANCSLAVTGVTDTGLPAEIKYEFTVPLEDSSLRWVTWSERGFIPFALPSPGETVRVKQLTLF
ncbi:MAG: hypothetical protein NTX06_09655 [Proteobacteria bacterium]|nr:hypothetical protein [Pseudomonadota bacterium]